VAGAGQGAVLLHYKVLQGQGATLVYVRREFTQRQLSGLRSWSLSGLEEHLERLVPWLEGQEV
jgi:hypothetical protein